MTLTVPAVRFVLIDVETRNELGVERSASLEATVSCGELIRVNVEGVVMAETSVTPIFAPLAMVAAPDV